LGLDPGPLTLRALVLMAEGRRHQQWEIASHLMALVANCHGNKAKPADLNPYPRPGRESRRSSGVPLRADGVESLARLLVEGKVGDE
jgi:hypothetical protein